MQTNEAREKLDLEPRDDLDGEYGKPDAAQPDSGGGLFGSEDTDTTPERDTDFTNGGGGGGGTHPRLLAEIPDKYVDGTGLSRADFVANADVADAARNAAEFVDEYGLPNPEDQQEGVARYNQLIDSYEQDEPIAPGFWLEILNFHARHRAQGNHVCDEAELPERADEINQNEFDKCMFDNGYFSDHTWGSDAGQAQAERVVSAIRDTDGVELSARHMPATPAWDAHMLDMHSRVWADDTKRALVTSGGDVPDFVQDRIRDAILQGAIFNDFETIAAGDIQQLQEYLIAEMSDNDAWTVDGLTDQLLQIDGLDSRDNAETIARTESAAAVNSAREDGYQERGQDEDRFYWSGGLDDRTTEACRWLIEKTNPYHGGSPVPLPELRELVDEAPEHDSDMPDTLARPDSWVVHPNERKTFVRAPRSQFGTTD
jgi:hypothetical protein